MAIDWNKFKERLTDEQKKELEYLYSYDFTEYVCPLYHPELEEAKMELFKIASKIAKKKDETK